MSKEHTSIHEFDLNLIREYFSNLERQGPGSPEVTLKALSFIDDLNEHSQILDIGCGTGGQTMVLAQNSPGHFTGYDISPDFIELFNKNASNLNLHKRVKSVQGSMEALPFKHEMFDLIWCEGAIYNIGFERGVKEWRQFLKAGGYIAISEATWFTSERPNEINDFWQDAYPEIDTIPNKLEQLQNAGYIPVATFIFPEYCWTEQFYDLQIPLRETFLKKYRGNKSVEAFISNQLREAELYKKYKAYYGYAFYIAKKI